VVLTTLIVEVANLATPGTTRPITFLIDSGALQSVVPAEVLAGLGIVPIATQEFRLADGESISRRKGAALYRYGDRVGGADVIFGEEGDATLIGALTLASLGFVLDPLRRELRPLPMILAAHGTR